MATKKPSLLQRLFGSIANSEAGNPVVTDTIGPILAEKYGAGDYKSLSIEALESLLKGHVDDYDAILAKMQEHPLAWKMPVDGVEGTVSPLKTMTSGAWENIKAHKGASIGTGLNAAGNIAGVVDNDKLLGQVLGTAGGALLASKGLQLGPLGIANMAMGGGNLGALFDKLRAKKEQEEQYQQQQYHGGTYGI